MIRARSLRVPAFALLLTVACGARTGLSFPGLDAGVPDAGSCAEDAGSKAACAPIPSSDLPAAASPATGTITGSDLQVSFCPGGVFARVVGSAVGPPPYSFHLDYAIGTSAVTPIDVQSPAGAADGILQATIGLAAAAPGEYSSNDPQGIALISFMYDVPLPCFRCDGPSVVRSLADCPPGCSTVCSHTGCEPCQPNWPQISYSASSWQLVLTSVTQADDAGTGLAYFTPHGIFTVSLVRDDGKGPGATVTASF